MKRAIASVIAAAWVVPAAVFGADAAPAADATSTTNLIGPRIQFESQMHDFGRAKAGEPVRLTYVFTNTGDQTLEVTEVRPTCGCTTAGDWSRKVEPGKTGTIAIQFNTANFNGSVQKTITTTCNDKRNSHPTLQLKGTVWRAIEVVPQLAYINNVVADSGPNVVTVRILNHEDAPLTLFPPQSNNKSVTAELKTIEAGKEFQVAISILPAQSQG